MISRLLSNNALTIIVSIGVLMLALVLSFYNKDFHYLSRLGNILTLVGIFQISRPQLTREEIRLTVWASDSPFRLNDPRHYRHVGEDVPAWLHEDLRNRFAVGTLGPITTFVGALTAAFGDLVNSPFGF